MWVRDNINTPCLESKAIKKGIEGTKMRVLIRTNLTFCTSNSNY